MLYQAFLVLHWKNLTSPIGKNLPSDRQLHFRLRIIPSNYFVLDPYSNITTQDDIVQVYSQSLPFDIHVQSIPTYDTFEYGYNYSSAGLKIHLKRNSLGFIRILNYYAF